MAKKFTAKQKAWRGIVALAVAICCLSVAPLIAISDQPDSLEAVSAYQDYSSVTETEEVVTVSETPSESSLEAASVEDLDSDQNEDQVSIEPEESNEVIIAPQAEDAAESEEQELAISTQAAGVASVQGASYGSLQEAVDAAKTGETVLLNEDVYECVTVESAKKIVIDLQKHTLDAQNKGVALSVAVDGCDITIKNGTIVNGKYVSTPYGAAINAPKKNKAIAIESVNFTNNGSTNAFAIAVGGTNVDDFGSVTVKNCKITGSAGGISIVSSQPAIIDDVEIYKNQGTTSAKEQLYIKGKKNVVYKISNTNIHDNVTVKSQTKSTVSVQTGSFEFLNCRITNNEASCVGGIQRTSGTLLTLTNTVVANNICSMTKNPSSSYPYAGGIGCAMSKSSETPQSCVKINGGALYGNKKGIDSPQPSDFVVTQVQNNAGTYDLVDIVAADNMSDSAVGANYFKSYGYKWVVNQALTMQNAYTTASIENTLASDGKIAFEARPNGLMLTTTKAPYITYAAISTSEPTPVAVVGEQEYMSLSAAFKAASGGETVRLYFKDGNKDDAVVVSESEPIVVDKPIVFDADGGFTSGSVSFQVEKGANLSLINSGDNSSLNNGFSINNSGSVSIGDGFNVGSVTNTDAGTTKLSGHHGVMNVCLENGQPIDVESGTTAEAISISLAKDKLNAINNGTLSEELVIVNCESSADAEGLFSTGWISIAGVTNSLAKMGVAGNKITLRLLDPTAVYIGGSKSNDTNDGLTVDTPVASFWRAEEVLAQNFDNLKEKKIFVVGEISVKDGEEWSLDNSELARYTGYEDALVRVQEGGSLVLNDVTLDGGSYAMDNRINGAGSFGTQKKEGITAKAPLIIVEQGATLTVAEGALLHSNCNKEAFVRGGAIHNEGTLEITGGTITDNESKHAGGGIYSYSDGMTMSGGVVSYNQTIAASDIVGPGGVYSAGGGICIAKGKLVMSGGSVENNKAVGKNCKGGGISIGGDALRNDISLVMTGGEVKKNSSYGVGGGISLDNNAVGTITAGTISDNVCNDGTNVIDAQNTYWGGGGIYVEGPQDGAAAAKLHLENVEIAENSGSTGAGIAACPTARDVRISIKDGAVIHDNKNGNDVTIATTALTVAGATYVTLPKYTANGYKYDWLNAEGKLASTEELNKVYTSTTGGAAFKSQLTGENAKKAAENCTVKITGNRSGSGSSSYPGGGIGSNGYLSIGNADTNFVLQKKVEGDTDPMYNEFEFEIAFTEGDSDDPYIGKMTCYKGGGDRTDVEALQVQTDEAGILTVSLKSDEYLLVRDLPTYLKYKVKEVTKSSSTILQGSVSNAEAMPNISSSVVDGKLEWTVENNGIHESTSNDSGVLQNGFNELVVTNEYLLGELTINKKLEGAVSTMANGEGNSTAVFHVEGTWGEGDNAKKIYDNYVAINFSKPGEASATLHGLLVGANYTVTEVVPSGSGYTIKEGIKPVQVGVLNKAEDNGTAKVSFSFENILDNEDHPNHGIINTYSYDSAIQDFVKIIQGARDTVAGNQGNE